MKKRIFLIGFIVVFSLAVFAACMPSGVKQNPRLSELRDNILVGEAGGYRVVAVTGMRENPFAIDGISQKEKVNFTVITVTPVTYLPGIEYEFEVKIGANEYKGKLVRHPFNNTYSTEIAVATLENSLEFIIKGAPNATVTLTSVKNENYIDADKAYSIAYNKLKSNIEDKSKDKEYEIFIRLIENPVNSSGGYYWYVAFIFEDDTTYACLIEPTSMEIVAVKD
jgi:hypothetical protein